MADLRATSNRRDFVRGALAAAAVSSGRLAFPSPAQAGVEARVLGTAQDGGVPQANCFDTSHPCPGVRSGTRPAPRVASLGIVDPHNQRRFLVDATPDFSDQVGDLLTRGPWLATLEKAVPLADHLHGILLTHAHIGHYVGLAQLGREAAASRGLPVWASPRMCDFLRDNAPWSALVAGGNVRLEPLTPGTRVELTPSVSVMAIEVVHRAEFTDTLGYLIEGPERGLLYVPDADSWDGWPVPFEDWLDRCDSALLDGTFYSHVELGHRAQAEVPHPPVANTVQRLRARGGRPEVWFTHLNHTNPLWNEASDESRSLPAGFSVARRGTRWAL